MDKSIIGESKITLATHLNFSELSASAAVGSSLDCTIIGWTGTATGIGTGCGATEEAWK